ncbi:MAG: GspE/PulE family protein [Candidatus Omnitrophica bacterium]|nr:GspE/PulE family protein [Candidatus Omnitrophota bacterium]
MAHKSNVELLVEKGIITKDQLNKAKEEVNKTGLPIEKALEKLGFISELDIAQVVADSIGVPFMNLTDYLIDPEVIKLVPESLAKKCWTVPLFKIGDSLTVAMLDPLDVTAIDEIRAKTKMGSVDPVLSTQGMIQNVLDQYYGSVGSVKDLTLELTQEKLDQKIKNAKGLNEVSEEAPVIKLVNMIIMEAVKDKASDIHVEPEEEMVRVRYRIDGILHETQQIMAKMDIAETRNPQDGRIQLKMENKDLDLRVSSFPTVYGENIVLRILDKTSVILGLGDLGLVEKDLKDFDKIIQRPNGIILVTGPTGSGKTTTLYSALSTVNSMEKNIITIEDPVEYEIPLIRQTQVNAKAGLTFATGLRSILRQDPDIIMVGEIRDKETAEIAIQASLTGHLVFSTLHTNDAASSLTRLIDMGVEPFLISTSVIAILAQRLVRVICPYCKEKYSPSSEVIKDLDLDSKITFYRGKGCVKCKQTGFIGRKGIFEFLLINEEIKNMVVAKSSASEIKKNALAHGMRTLFDDGLEKAKNGITTIEEVLRVSEET